MNFSIIFVIFAVAVLKFSSAKFACTPGVPYRENDCNQCLCIHWESLGCTYMSCSGPKYDELRNCEVGSTTKIGCNTCTCVKDQGTICTDNKC